MADLPRARSVEPGTAPDPGAERVTLDYAARFLRRKRLVSDAGRAFVVDLPQVVSLEAGDRLILESAGGAGFGAV